MSDHATLGTFKLTHGSGRLSEVVVNGTDIGKAVQGVRMTSNAADKVAVVELHLLAWEDTRIEVEEARLIVPKDTAEALIVLGWTPPPKDGTRHP